MSEMVLFDSTNANIAYNKVVVIDREQCMEGIQGILKIPFCGYSSGGLVIEALQNRDLVGVVLNGSLDFWQLKDLIDVIVLANLGFEWKIATDSYSGVWSRCCSGDLYLQARELIFWSELFKGIHAVVHHHTHCQAGTRRVVEDFNSQGFSTSRI
jgi:hypothetical protein